jgi:hypothetical protein
VLHPRLLGEIMFSRPFWITLGIAAVLFLLMYEFGKL